MDCLTPHSCFFLTIFYPEGIKIPAPWLCSLLVIPSQKASSQGKALLSHPGSSPFSHTHSLSTEIQPTHNLLQGKTLCSLNHPLLLGLDVWTHIGKKHRASQWEEEKEGYKGRKMKCGRMTSSLLGEYHIECRPGNITILEVISLIEFSSFILSSMYYYF